MNAVILEKDKTAFVKYYHAINLEVFVEKDPPVRVTNPEACGLRHLAFQVEIRE